MNPDAVGPLLLQAQRAIERQNVDLAHELVQRVLKTAPSNRAGLMLKAVICAARDEPEEAIAALDEALGHHPGDVTLLISKASFLMDFFDAAEEALPLLEEVAEAIQSGVLGDDEEAQEMAEETWLLLSECRAANQDFDGALDAAREAEAAAPQDPVVHLSVANALFDLGRLDEAVAAAEEARKHDADHAEASWMVGRVKWVRGDEDAGDELKRAVAAAPDRFFMPMRADREAVLRAVKQGIGELPPSLREALGKVQVVVEDAPTPQQLNERDPPASAGVIGLHAGKPIELGEGEDPLLHVPPKITLFRRNLEFMSADEKELKELAVITMLHEIARYVGKDLAELDRTLGGG